MINLLAGERIDQLFSENVKVIQSKKVFSYSIDSVLLVKFLKLPTKNGKILDLCAGNGAVGLFASQFTKVAIVQIELQERLADMARRSIKLNNLERQITMFNIDLKEARHFFDHDSFSHILCNPPYFKYLDTSKKNPNEHFAIARHEISATLADTVEITRFLLKDKGHFAMVHRPDRFLEILEIFKKNRITPKRLQFIYPKNHKVANTLLIEGIKNGKDYGLKILPPLIVHDEDGSYSEEVKKIYYEK